MNYIIRKAIFTSILILIGINCVKCYPYPAEDFRYLDRDSAKAGAHQLASWIASQLKYKDYISPPQDGPILPYRLPLQGKRNSEVSNAIIGSEETQKLYRNDEINEF